MELLQKEERLRSKERELERKAKELEEKERTAARKREKEKELERAQKEREAKEREAQQQASAAAGASRGTAESDEIPNEYLCPITLNIMTVLMNQSPPPLSLPPTHFSLSRSLLRTLERGRSR